MAQFPALAGDKQGENRRPNSQALGLCPLAWHWCLRVPTKEGGMLASLVPLSCHL